MNVVNLTAHPVSVWLPDGRVYCYPPSGIVCRVEEVTHPVDQVDGVRIVSRETWGLQHLPPAREGTLYLASAAVARAAVELDRLDVVCPDTRAPSAVMRGGRIVAVRQLRTFAGGVRLQLAPAQSEEGSHAG